MRKCVKTRRGELRWLLQCFRILDGWNVRRVEHHKYGGQVSYGKSNALIYGFDGRPTPCDFVLHEVLHVVLQALRSVRGGRSQRYAEEHVVQDICKVVRRMIGKKH
jgi:hypothetical protein